MSKIQICILFWIILILPTTCLKVYSNIKHDSSADLSAGVLSNPSSFTLRGKVIDYVSKAPIEFATVSLTDIQSSMLKASVVSNSRGEYTIPDIPSGRYTIQIDFIGYQKYTSKEIYLNGNNLSYRHEVVQLKIDVKQIGEVTVQSGSNRIKTFDKQTIFTENLLAGAGGSAAELLKGAPGITLSVDGRITIHGSTQYRVLINGKPSAMQSDELLQNTSAAEIKKIELITNPSAKYDAAGSAGIINLITYRNNISGLSSGVTLAAEDMGGYSGDLIADYKWRKFSFFAGADNKLIRLGRESDQLTTYYDNNNPVQFFKVGEQCASKRNLGYRGGFDWFINEKSTLSFSGYDGTVKITNNGNWTTRNETLIQSTTTIQNGTSIDENRKEGRYSGADMGYILTFGEKGNKLSVNALWNRQDIEDNSENNISTNQPASRIFQSTLINSKTNSYQINMDGSFPLSKSGILETGYQYTDDRQNEDYSSHLNSNPRIAGSEGSILFDRYIHALYATTDLKLGVFQTKIGLRAEYLIQNIENKGGEHFDQEKLYFYPSAITSWTINKRSDLQINYNRRTDRLKLKQLDPLLKWYDFYNVLSGDPRLINEITDRLSLDYSYKIGSHQLAFSLYRNVTFNKIEIIRSQYENQIIHNRFTNVGDETTLGSEFNGNFQLLKNLRFNVKADFIRSYYDFKHPDLSGERKYWQWYGSSILEYAMTSNASFRMDFNYMGKALIAQGEIRPNYSIDLTFRHFFFNKKMTLTLTGKDLFRMKEVTDFTRTAEFNQRNITRDLVPLRLSLSYRFNSYKKDERRSARTPNVD